jgi:chromate transporter
MSAFLDGVNVAAIGLILYIAYTIGIGLIHDWRTILLFILSLIILLYLPKINSAFLIVAGGIMGYLLYSA